MIGFFEHQYLSYKKSHLHNLIALAKADGQLHEDEEKLIYKIGEHYGLKDRQIASLIVSTKSREVHVPESHLDKMNQMYDLLLMVHADKVVEKREIEFCEHIAELFGFKKELVTFMLEQFEGSNPVGDDWEKVIETAEEKYRHQA